MAQTSLKWLNRTEYPFKDNYFELSMGKMHYLDEGKGEPIVLVHGNPGWSFEFRNVIKSLSGKYRCIAPDHIGFGLSDKPQEWDYLPQNQALNFEKLMNYLNLNNITVVVNDWGGPIGLSYAIKYPEKIKKLVILNTWLWSVENDPYYRKFSNLMGGKVGSVLNKYFNIFGKMVVKQVFGDKTKLTKDIHRHYYMHMDSPNLRKGMYVFPFSIIGSSNWLAQLWSQKERINNIPTTFIWGMKDIAFRESELKVWLENWKNPKVIELDTVGHYPQEESPEIIVNEIVNG